MIPRRILAAATILVAAASVPPGTMAQSADAPVPPTADFVRQAAIGGLFEMDISRLALERSKNPDIVRFAQRMINDHGDANNALKMTVKADKLELALPSALDAAHSQKYEAMKRAKGEDFDSAFVTAQSDAHFEAVALFVAYAKGGDDPKLKAFAEKTVPTLRAHQDALAHLGAR